MSELLAQTEAPPTRRAPRTGPLSAGELMDVAVLQHFLLSGGRMHGQMPITDNLLLKFFQVEYDCHDWDDVMRFAPIARGYSAELSLSVRVGAGSAVASEQLRFYEHGEIGLVIGDERHPLACDQTHIQLLAENLFRLGQFLRMNPRLAIQRGLARLGIGRGTPLLQLPTLR